MIQDTDSLYTVHPGNLIGTPKNIVLEIIFLWNIHRGTSCPCSFLGVHTANRYCFCIDSWLDAQWSFGSLRGPLPERRRTLSLGPVSLIWFAVQFNSQNTDDNDNAVMRIRTAIRIIIVWSSSSSSSSSSSPLQNYHRHHRRHHHRRQPCQCKLMSLYTIVLFSVAYIHCGNWQLKLWFFNNTRSLFFWFPFGSSGISPLAQVDSLVKKILSEEPLIHESTKDTWPQKITSQPNVMLFGFLFF